MLNKDEQEARRKRAKERARRIVVHRAVSFEDAEQWDLAYWQAKTPQERLSALVDIHRDVEKVKRAKDDYEHHP